MENINNNCQNKHKNGNFHQIVSLIAAIAFLKISHTIDVQLEARNYVDNLMGNGELEQDSDSEMKLPPWYDSELCKM